MNLERQDIDGAALITLQDARLDAAMAVQFKDALRGVADEGDGRVVLDLSAVEFMDSSGLGAVVAAMKLLGGDRPLELAGLTPTVQKVFRLTRMDTVFTIHETSETAFEGRRHAS